MDRSQDTLRRMTNGILLQTKSDVHSELGILYNELSIGNDLAPKKPTKKSGYLEQQAYRDWANTQFDLSAEADELEDYFLRIQREITRRDTLRQTAHVVESQRIPMLETYWQRRNKAITTTVRGIL